MLTTFPLSGVLWEQGTGTGNTYGPGRPARLPGAKMTPEFFLRCRSASESVFPGILDQIFQGFVDLKNVFLDVEAIYVLEVKYLTNVCDMHVMMYVVCAGRTER